MKTFRSFVLFLAIGAAACWAAQRMVVHQVQLTGPMGTDTGHLIATDTNLIFVDDVNSDMSFTIPKVDVRAINVANGVTTISMSRPFSEMYGSRSDVVMQFKNPESAILIANWAGMPLSGTVGETYTTVERSRTEVEPITAMQFNVRHDDDEGRLVVGQYGIEWHDLKNTRKSHTWNYADIKEFKRDKNESELKLKPYNGDEFAFKVEGRWMTDDVYNMIADRIVAAHR
jgi:hypothetical protein